MNKFLKELMTLATELNEAEGFNALTVINDMELLYDKHVAELKKLHIADVRERFAEFVENQKDIDPEIAKIINDNFLDLL